MTTKTLTGSYPSGYYLKPIHQTLDIAATAYVGGSGITTNDVAPSNVNNLGTVLASNSHYGVSLSDGGRVTNGGTANGVALIQGDNGGVAITGESGTVINHGTIDSTILGVRFSDYYERHTSVLLRDGGLVINDDAAVIGAGVSISGASGTIVNNGSIGGGGYRRFYYVYTYAGGYNKGVSYYDPSVVMYAGGRVTNGDADHTSAALSRGVFISGGAGMVANSGSIGAVYGRSVALESGGSVNNVASGVIGGEITIAGGQGAVVNAGKVDGSIILSDGGSVANGSSSVVAAMVNGTISISGAPGLVVNFGTAGSVDLTGGGTVRNGGAASSAALVPGGIFISGGRGVVANYGSVGGPTSQLSGPTSSITLGDPSVDLDAGGVVSNGISTDTGADLAGGILIFGGSGKVTNFGTIGPRTETAIYKFSGPKDTFDLSGPSVSMELGGAVVNGADADVVADIAGGVLIGGGRGQVTNFGTISDGTVAIGYRSTTGLLSNTITTPSVYLRDGGSVVNGDSGDSHARLSASVLIGGGRGTVSNYGLIGESTERQRYLVNHLVTITTTSFYSLNLDAGGSVANGAAGHALARIANGVSVSGGTGTVSNFGTIEVSGTSTVNPAAGVILSGGGRIANGAAGQTKGVISGVTGVILDGAGTVTNYATIASSLGTGGVAVQFGGATDTLVEEGGAVLIGQVLGGGGHLVLGSAAGTGTIAGIGGSITGFDSIAIQAGAGWHFTGAQTIAAGVMLSNAAAIVDDGSLVNDGTIDASALVELTTDAVLNNAADGKIYLKGDVGISPATGATGTVFVNAGLLEKLSGTGTSSMREVITDTGRIVVASGVLDLAGTGNTIAGLISGAGTIDFRLGASVLEAGTTITAAGFEITGTRASVTVDTNLTYTHAFLAAGGASLTVGAGDTLDLIGAVRGGGMLNIGAGATIQFGTTVALGGKVGFAGAGGTLVLADAADFRASVSGFGAGQTIDLHGGGFGTGTKLSYVGSASSGVLTVSDNGHVAKIALLGQFAAANFQTASDGHGGVDITFAATPAPALATPD